MGDLGLSLRQKECVPCKGGVPPLRGDALAELSAQLPEWKVVAEHHITRTFVFPDFKTALAFVNRAGDIAEAQGHHPDMLLAWGRVEVKTYTHKIDGLTESDFILAAKNRRRLQAVVAMAAYDRDLAYIHDTGFTTFARQAAPELLRLLHQAHITHGLVVDAGCGSGVWARELTGRGYDVLGIDISPDMVRLARKQAPAAKFRVGSFLSAALPACDAVTSIGECVNYAFDRKNGKKRLAEFFRRVYAALRPGGIFLFDIVEPGLVPEGMQRRFLEGPDWAILLEVREDAKAKTLTRRIVSFRRVGKLFRRSEETHRLHLYTGAELQAELRRAGFEVQLMAGYVRFRFAPAHASFLARKPM